MSESSISHLTEAYLTNPFPLWELDFTNVIVRDYLKRHNVTFEEHSILNSILQENIGEKPVFYGNIDSILLESSSNYLDKFYFDHGIESMSKEELHKNNAETKIQKALDIFKEAGIYEFIITLTRTIQVLKNEDNDIDISFSHPDIPFSIFISLCKGDSDISNIRVAESILHECMHLKLTLIENLAPLVSSENSFYYSPWKKEYRPAKGILHGLFVFRALLDFYNELKNSYIYKSNILFINKRIVEITNELNEVKDFVKSPSLTINGLLLTKNLLPLN